MTVMTSRPIPPAVPTHWVRQASCRSYEPDMFFPDGHTHPLRIEAARDICRACPVRDACLTDALEKQEPYGIRGGLTKDERDDVLRKRTPATRQKAIEKALKQKKPGVVEVLEMYPRVAELRTEGRSQRNIAVELDTSRRALRLAMSLVNEAGSPEAALERLVVAA